MIAHSKRGAAVGGGGGFRGRPADTIYRQSIGPNMNAGSGVLRTKYSVTCESGAWQTLVGGAPDDVRPSHRQGRLWAMINLPLVAKGEV